MLLAQAIETLPMWERMLDKFGASITFASVMGMLGYLLLRWVFRRVEKADTIHEAHAERIAKMAAAHDQRCQKLADECTLPGRADTECEHAGHERGGRRDEEIRRGHGRAAPRD